MSLRRVDETHYLEYLSTAWHGLDRHAVVFLFSDDGNHTQRRGCGRKGGHGHADISDLHRPICSGTEESTQLLANSCENDSTCLDHRAGERTSPRSWGCPFASCEAAADRRHGRCRDPGHCASPELLDVPVRVVFSLHRVTGLVGDRLRGCCRRC